MPCVLIVSVLKVATPETAFTVSVPPSVPELGFVPMAMLTEAVLPVITFPLESSTETVTAGLITLPATVFEGCTPKTS